VHIGGIEWTEKKINPGRMQRRGVTGMYIHQCMTMPTFGP
jgi:hypothetical protein